MPLFTHVLGLIPARGGSRQVPRKNLRALQGRSLLAWTIDSALASGALDRLIVSTDDDEIATEARAAGAEVPFIRPAEFATDTSGDYDVYRHAIDWLAEHEAYRPDALAWLRPTSPLRGPEDLSGALQTLQDSGADCVRSVCPVEHHPYWMKKREGDLLTPFLADYNERDFPRRQMLPPLYRLNGCIDVVRCDRVPEGGPLFGGDMAAHEMSSEQSHDIDTESDLQFVEWMLERKSR